MPHHHRGRIVRSVRTYLRLGVYVSPSNSRLGAVFQSFTQTRETYCRSKHGEEILIQHRPDAALFLELPAWARRTMLPVFRLWEHLESMQTTADVALCAHAHRLAGDSHRADVDHRYAGSSET